MREDGVCMAVCVKKLISVSIGLIISVLSRQALILQTALPGLLLLLLAY